MSIAIQVQSAISTLREHTRHAHQALERLPLLSRLVAEDLTRSEYELVLRLFYGYMAPLHALLGAHRFDSVQPGRDHTAMLQADLVALGVRPDSVERCLALPLLHNEARRAGAVYVLEGSMLGGTLITRALRKSLPAESALASRYFGGYGNQNGVRWRRFIGRFDNVVTAPMEACAGAIAVFGGLRDWVELNTAGSERFDDSLSARQLPRERSTARCPFSHLVNGPGNATDPAGESVSVPALQPIR